MTDAYSYSSLIMIKLVIHLNGPRTVAVLYRINVYNASLAIMSIITSHHLLYKALESCLHDNYTMAHVNRKEVDMWAEY